MRRTYYILTFFVFWTTVGISQTTNLQNPLMGDIQSDLKVLLPSGIVKADIMDGVLQSPRQVELTKKFKSAIRENYDWFLEYRKTIPKGEPMPYHSNLGLTKDEYTELAGFMDNIEVVSTGNENIVIEATTDCIRFKSHNRLAMFDSLTIDLKNNIATFRQYRMPFADTVDITTEKNGLKSEWRGYIWNFESSGSIGVGDFKDVSTLNLVQYKLTVGRLEKNGRTYISLKGKEVKDGIKTIDFELPVQF